MDKHHYAGFHQKDSPDVVPLSDLVGKWVACVGLGNVLIWTVGYVIVQVQVDGAQGYDEDQIALVILDLSSFMAQVPVILGTPMISHIVNMIKEREIDTLVTPWVNAWVAYLLAVWWATATVEDNKVTTGELDPAEYDEIVTTKDTKTIDTFPSHIIHVRMGTAYTGVGLNVMTQALCAEDGSLPQGMTIQNGYTEMCDGSKNAAIVVRNSMAYPQTLTMKQRQEKLFEELDLSGLESWPPKLVDSSQSLLAEYHNVFLRAQWTQLYSFNWTCDQSHQWCPI